jgi:hypothetical protein
VDIFIVSGLKMMTNKGLPDLVTCLLMQETCTKSLLTFLFSCRSLDLGCELEPSSARMLFSSLWMNISCKRCFKCHSMAKPKLLKEHLQRIVSQGAIRF